VRFVAALLFWLVTTLALAVAVPAMWAQKNVIDPDGYAALAASAAEDPRLQEAMASELTTQASALISEGGDDLSSGLIRGVASAYTASPAFPGQFAQANRIAHRWMFTDSAQRAEGTDDQWVVDLAPMLADASFQQTLANLNIEVPDTLTVPVTVSNLEGLRPGQLRMLSKWGPWVSVGSAILAGFFGLLTLATARSRGKALAALGVSALLVGAGGWAGLELVRRYIDDALDRTTGDVREVADVMVVHAEDGLHQWLNLTLAAGGLLVVLGIVVAMLGGLRRRD
jgi:hypothetical protein